MKDVWRIFSIQAAALRWWLLVWCLALAFWVTARRVNLTNGWESWETQESYFAYGLMILSALLVAAVLHLFPSAKRVTGWRAWPLQRWKVPAAQCLFTLVFLVLLPGAAETVFLFHPKLEGFMGTGLIECLMRSLWPLPVALGLAACSQSLRRFILDALILTGIAIAALSLWTASWRWKTPSAPGADNSYALFRWVFLCLPAVMLLLWGALCARRISPAKGRLFLFLTPLLMAGVLVTARFTGRDNPDYMPVVQENTRITERINLRVTPRQGDPLHVSSTDTCLAADIQLDGLHPDESAHVTFWRTRAAADGVPDTFAREEAKGAASFGDDGWYERALMSGTPSLRTVSLGWFPPDKLLLLKGKRWRIETTAMVTFRHSEEAARLPLVKGAGWREPGVEVTVEFVRSNSQDRQGNESPAKPLTIVSVVYRRFGLAMTKGWLGFEIIHKPSGLTVSLYSRNLRFTAASDRLGAVDSARYVFGSARIHGGRWPEFGLSQWLLSHPEEFDLILRRRVSDGGFLREVTAEGATVLAVPGHFAETALPDLKSPESVETFFRELEAYEIAESYAGIVPLLTKCGPDILPALEEFCLRNPQSRLNNPVSNHARELNAALFKPERPDHRLAFFKGHGRTGLFMGADPSTPAQNKTLLAEGLAWVKDDPDHRLNDSWLYQMRNDAPPELYPAIRGFLQREGHMMPWRSWLRLPGLEPPAIIERSFESSLNGPSPTTEGEFYSIFSLQLTAPQKSYHDAVRQGQPWAARLGFVIAVSSADDPVAALWLKVWPEVSDCPKEEVEARAWMQTNADRLRFNPDTRRYEHP